LLKQAQQDILYLLERGYPMKSASTFVGNHYMLSERQRLAIVRATAQTSITDMRLNKQLIDRSRDATVYIDGLNLIITLEVALSGSTLIRCMDGAIRDLAGLRGTYRLIDKTDQAILLIDQKLKQLLVKEAVFYLDSPVSNTGRLKQKILELLNASPYIVSVELVANADVCLEGLEQVISSDSIVINKCKSWINLAAEIIDEKLPNIINIINLSHI
jgi:hypothetical protein